MFDSIYTCYASILQVRSLTSGSWLADFLSRFLTPLPLLLDILVMIFLRVLCNLSFGPAGPLSWETLTESYYMLCKKWDLIISLIKILLGRLAASGSIVQISKLEVLANSSSVELVNSRKLPPACPGSAFLQGDLGDEIQSFNRLKLMGDRPPVLAKGNVICC